MKFKFKREEKFWKQCVLAYLAANPGTTSEVAQEHADEAIKKLRERTPDGTSQS